MSARTGRRSASPARDGGEEPPKESKSLRTIFQRKSPEEIAQRRSMLADLVRQTSELEEGRPWSGPTTAPAERGNEKSSPAIARRVTADGPLRFASHFECGNLLSAKLVLSVPPKSGLAPIPGAAPGADLEYELLVDADTQSAQGHTQWFYFSVRNGGFCGTVQFRIVNLRKKKSLYQQGLQPFVFSTRKKQRGWEPFVCQAVSYSPSAKRGDKEGLRGDFHTLQWSYRIERKEDELFFAAYPPYTYSMMQSFLSCLEQEPAARAHFVRAELCRSIGQLPVPVLAISQGLRMEDAEGCDESRAKAKYAIVITARQHPGEVVGSWAVQGLLRFLLGPTPAACRLREVYLFHVIPMVNVDGVVHGNSRCTLAGVDPNRVWHDPNPILHPVIFALKNHLRSLSQGLQPAATHHIGGSSSSSSSSVRGLEMFLDLHGHSAKQIAVHDGAQTEELAVDHPADKGEDEPQAAGPEGEPHNGEPEEAAPESELYHESMEPMDTTEPPGERPTASSRKGVWLGLRGTTESQANKLLGSLEHDLDTMEGIPSLPAAATLDDEATTLLLPGEAHSFPEGGATTLPDGDEGGESEPSGPSSSAASHRRLLMLEVLEEEGSPDVQGKGAKFALLIAGVLRANIVTDGPARDLSTRRAGVRRGTCHVPIMQGKVQAVEAVVNQQMQDTVRALDRVTQSYDKQANALDEVKVAQAALEHRLHALETKPLSTAAGSTLETLKAAKDVLRSLDVPLNGDEFFVPGLRRRYAILPITPKPFEDEDARRQRVQGAIQHVIMLGKNEEEGMRKLWVAISHSPERRRCAKLAGKVKRTILELGGNRKDLEVEFATGGPLPPALFRVDTWNVGGLTAQRVLELTQSFVGDPDLRQLPTHFREIFAEAPAARRRALRHAQWKRNKATGPDAIIHELLWRAWDIWLHSALGGCGLEVVAALGSRRGVAAIITEMHTWDLYGHVAQAQPREDSDLRYLKPVLQLLPCIQDRSTTRIRKDSSRSTASELNLYQDCMEPIADKPLEARGAKGGTSLGLAPGLGYVGQPQAKPKQPWAAWIWMPFGCFFYGSNPTAHISNAVFPKMCSAISTDLSFEQCHWRCTRSHRKTARYVVYKQFGVKYTYTIECSLFAPVDTGAEGSEGHFTPSRVEFVGCAVGCGLALFFNVDLCSVAQACPRRLRPDTPSLPETLEQGGLPGSRPVPPGSAEAPEVQEEACVCEGLLLDLSCPRVLRARPWFQTEVLDTITAAEVLEGLTANYGEVVPDLARLTRDGSDDGGDSDGDDADEEERVRTKEATVSAAVASPTSGARRKAPCRDSPQAVAPKRANGKPVHAGKEEDREAEKPPESGEELAAPAGLAGRGVSSSPTPQSPSGRSRPRAPHRARSVDPRDSRLEAPARFDPLTVVRLSPELSSGLEMRSSPTRGAAYWVEDEEARPRPARRSEDPQGVTAQGHLAVLSAQAAEGGAPRGLCVTGGGACASTDAASTWRTPGLGGHRRLSGQVVALVVPNWGPLSPRISLILNPGLVRPLS
ncbi:Cytosolic carboxypeptidase 4 [Symbiodinium microadriaticum]|uniref:Cytosolic carboxypeptidase 4 n=1 Tax=Symbiodinium microadriaticum TaxID=2951 RepID=A0A1Q9CY10_SYMMI|nr:Cytosolic carboxypeptidase 4 [Symbiodinium microadriaticum]